MASTILLPLQEPLKGQLKVPGDKSISHRAVIFGSLAAGRTTISHFLDGEDCMRTINAFRIMGVDIKKDGNMVTINSDGADRFIEPSEPIYLGNSGTTARLLLGVLAGLPYHFSLYGDESLSKRPMDRITVPLKKMGATIDGREMGKLLPLSIRGGNLSPITYEVPVKSAQVKSGVLLAGLLADGKTVVTEKAETRNHTETMIEAFGGKIEKDGNKLSIEGKQKLSGAEIEVPGDISSAAFFLAAGVLVKGSRIVLRDVGLNPTRSGIIDILTEMGADLEVEETRSIGGEAIGDITVCSSSLKGIEISGDIIPRIIDELPIIALLATQAEGQTVIKDAEELRFKETDRIAVVVETLKKLGARLEGTKDGMVIEGNDALSGATVDSFGDHRIGMMIAVASLVSSSAVELTNKECIAVSYPRFFDDLALLSH